MSFASPIAFLLAGLALPVVLLYLLKQRRRRVEVSTLLFWDEILRDEKSVTSWTRLRKWLSLALQLLFLALLIFALARPVFSSELLGARRMVVLLDASASMTAVENGTTRFDDARRLARQVIRGMGMGDTLLLAAVSNDAAIVSPFTNIRKDLLEAVDGLAPRHTPTNFASARALIENLPPDERPTCVYVISDGAWEAFDLAPPEDTRFAFLPVGETQPNVGITRFELRPLPASPRDFEVLLEVLNTGEEDLRVAYDLSAEDDLIEVGELMLPPGEPVRRSFQQFSRTGGAISLTLDHEDAFALDNTAHAVLPLPDPLPVRLVTSGNLFLESVLMTDDRIALDVVAPADYEPAPFGGVWLFDRWSPKTEPPDHAVYIGAWPDSLGIAAAGRIEEPIITEWDREHPVNRHLHLANIRIESARAITAPGDFEVLIESFEHPLVLLRTGSQWKTLVLAFDTAASDLPLRVAFPILAANTVRHMLVGDAAPHWEPPPAGAILTLEEAQAYASGVDGALAAVLKPGEAQPDEEHPASREAVVLDRTGVYRAIPAEGEPAPLFAVNLTDRQESRTAPAAVLPIRVDGGLPQIEGGMRLGIEPWFFLAVLALGLIAAEWLLFHRRWAE